MGKLFLDVAKSMDQLAGEYTRSCAFIEYGLQENSKVIPIALGSAGQDLYSSKTKSLFASVHDRLSRYPILLKETERYYEVCGVRWRICDNGQIEVFPLWSLSKIPLLAWLFDFYRLFS